MTLRSPSHLPMTLRSPSHLTSSPPQSYLGRAHCYPHIGECTVPLRVLAVACTVHNEALWKHYGSIAHRYKTLQNVMERYIALQEITERYGSITELLQNVMKPLRKISILPITN